MQQKETLFWIWLSEALGPKNRDFRTLIELYESPYALFNADESEIERIADIKPRTKEVLAQKSLAQASRVLDACERLQIKILPYDDDAYPNSLRELREPPVLLYYYGRLPDFNKQLCIGIVGTRRMSAYGLQSAYKIAYELASANVVIVSGMAAGIDGVSAAATLAAKGTTVAVLGCGLDVVYPNHHKQLMELIRENGVILSEYPPATKPNYYHFPVRNRIISGISRGTVVVEASMQSGSLITAKDAVLQGKEVFALPANVDSSGAEGTNRLLRDGATLVLDTMDILQPYQYVYANQLQVERLQEAKKHSRADLRYLDRVGVIELTKRTSPAERPAPEASPMPAPRPRPDTPQRETAPAPKNSAGRLKSESPRKTGAPSKDPSPTPDAVLSSLTPIQLAVLQAIPDDRAITADVLQSLEFPWGEVIAALTMLEILGLIQKLPGALYTKA